MSDFLTLAYPWTTALHIMSVIAWMAGIFYLPRLFVYHAEQAPIGSEQSRIFKEMELKLLRYIMKPAMISTWIFGMALVFTPGVVDWSMGWAHAKATLVIAMTAYHMALARWRKEFAADGNQRSGRFYRLANEVPTLIMVGIVILVVVKPF